MNTQEKKYASKRIKEISREKENEIRQEQYEKQNAVRKAVADKQLSGDAFRAEARKKALKNVKPEFETMANIKKAVLSELAGGKGRVSGFPVGNVIQAIGQMDCEYDGWGFPTGRQKPKTEVTLIKNAKAVSKEIGKQEEELSKSQREEMNKAVCKVNEKYVPRFDKLRVATQEAVDSIMLGEAEEAVKAIANFAKKKF